MRKMKKESWINSSMPHKWTIAASALGIGFAIFFLLPIAVTKEMDDQLTTSDLEEAIRAVETQIEERSDCGYGTQGYYEFSKRRGVDKVVICRNNFSALADDYWKLLAHEATHIMQACLGTTINDPDRLKEMRQELRVLDEDSYRTIHRDYPASRAGREIEARWMETRPRKEVLENLEKYCA